MDILLTIVFLLLIILFVISFVLFIKRLIINSLVEANNSTGLARKVDRLIEQNEQILLLLKEKK